MALGAAAVVQKVLDVIEGLDEVSRRLGEFVKNGPDGGLAGHVRDGYRRRCRQYANVPGWLKRLSPTGARTFGNMCDPYLENNNWSPPVSAPSFSGGQCEAAYVASVSWEQADSGCNVTQGSNPSLGVGFGPISLQFVTVGTPPGSPVDLCPGFSYNRVLLTNRDGQVTLVGASRGVRLLSFNIAREDGQPDDCGNPPPDLLPGPTPPPNPPDDGTPDPTDNPGDPADPIVPIPPFVDPRFGPIPIDFSPTGGSDRPGATPTQSEPGSGDSVGDPIEGVGSGEPEDSDVDFGDPPEGRVWVGALLQVLAPSFEAVIPSEAPVNDVYPRVVGNAALRYEGGRGTAVRIRSEWSEHFRPVDALQVKGLSVSLRPSFSWRVFPISRETCPEDKCAPPQAV